jgi:hypothetical protein
MCTGVAIIFNMNERYTPANIKMGSQVYIKVKAAIKNAYMNFVSCL